MSYSFGMTFFEARNKLEAYEKATEFVTTLMSMKTAIDYVRQNARYFQCLLFKDEKRDIDCQISRILDPWLSQLFTIQCTYWPQHNLLGITGDEWPKVCKSLAAGSVHFQNGTDQDYEYEYWPTAIPFFKERVDAVKRMTDDEVQQIYELSCDDIEYVRRSLVYQTIAEDLTLDDWIYSGTGDCLRFAMSGITSGDILLDLYPRCSALLKRAW